MIYFSFFLNCILVPTEGMPLVLAIMVFQKVFETCLYVQPFCFEQLSTAAFLNSFCYLSQLLFKEPNKY